MKYPELTQDYIELCRDKGMLQREIAALIGCDRQLVLKRAKRFKIKFTRNRIKYPVFNEFFHAWSHDMSYVLGFIMTDGCVRKQRNSYQVKIEINMKDISVLEFIREKTSPTRPIRTNLIHKNASGSISRSAELLLTVTKETFKLLNSYGIVPRKSGKEKIPPNIPKKFIWSFIRGAFDGDGSIYRRKQGGFDWCICSSSKIFAQQLHQIIPFSKMRKNRSMWIVIVRTKEHIKKIREVLYQDSSFHLKRKYDKLQEIH
jgi:DNA-binding transcriptional regulator WhiA